MPDRIFDEPRLAVVYDALDADRSDLDVYLRLAKELGVRSVVDIGCGTGTFACLLTAMGIEAVGIDPAAAMLEVARSKSGADRVRWIHGVAADLPALTVDLVTMTANVAQVFLDNQEWMETLRAARRVLRSGGSLVFETRRPEQQAWLEWNPTDSYAIVEVDGAGVIETWNEVTRTELPLVTFRGTIVFHSDGTTLESESTLRFRSYDEIVASLEATGFRIDDVRDAPDRPGREWVFVATRA